MTKLTNDTKIAILLGGLSDEREVSIQTGMMVEAVLEENGYKNILVIDMDKSIVDILEQENPDVVFNALHGTFGEDGAIQGVLEILGLPYTSSGIAASALGMDKHISKLLMNSLQIKSANGYMLTEPESSPEIDFPLIVKDANNGSSKGIFLIKNSDEWNAVMDQLNKNTSYMVEEYFKGREIQVAVIADEVLGEVEIIPAGEFYDYEAKYISNSTKYDLSPEYSEKIREQIWSAALNFHKYLGCKGATRSDFIVKGDEYIMLEMNTLPGMTSHSLLPMIAKKRGISYLKLIETLLDEALSK